MGYPYMGCGGGGGGTVGDTEIKEVAFFYRWSR